MSTGIHVRELTSSPTAETPRYWFAGDVFMSHFFNAVSSTFPEGERFFIRSVRYYEPMIHDKQLQQEIAAFVGQEGRHSKEHDHHVQLLADQDYRVLITANRAARSVMTWLNQHAPRLSLALTTAIEHVTAVTARQILEHPEHWIEPMDPGMRGLWQWHAVEEFEHKAVAFDVYQRAVGVLWLRRLAMLHATLGFLAEIFVRQSLLLLKDRAFTPGVLWRGFKALFGEGGYIRATAPALMAFYAADFHPAQADDGRLLAKRRAEWGL